MLNDGTARAGTRGEDDAEKDTHVQIRVPFVSDTFAETGPEKSVDS